MLTIAILTTLATLGDNPPAGIARTYDLTAAQPWVQNQTANTVFVPYLENAFTEPASMIDQVSGDGSTVVETVRGLCPQDWDYEGRELLLEERGQLFVRAPQPVHDALTRVLGFLESSVGATMEFTVDVLVLPPSGGKDPSVSSLIPISEVAGWQAAADQGGSRQSYRLHLHPGVTGRIDASTAFRVTTDYDVEIAQATAVFNPIVETFHVGTRILAEAAPGQGGAWLGLVLRQGRPVHGIEDREQDYSFLVTTTDRMHNVPAPHGTQDLPIVSGSCALNTFVPDGKALVVQSSIESGGVRTTELVIVRQTGKLLAISAKFPGETGRSPMLSELIVLDAAALAPPRCELTGDLGEVNQSPHWNASMLHHGGSWVVGAMFQPQGYDKVHAQFQLNDGTRVVLTSGPWVLMHFDMNNVDAKNPPKAEGDDPLAAFAKLVPEARLHQIALTLKRGGGERSIARWILPVREGESSTGVVGREHLALDGYSSVVAQSASVNDPVLQNEFDGLIVSVLTRSGQSGGLSVDVDAHAHVQRGAARRFDPRTQTLGTIEETDYDQLDLHETVMFDKGDANRRSVLGDSGNEGLRLEIEVLDLR